MRRRIAFCCSVLMAFAGMSVPDSGTTHAAVLEPVMVVLQWQHQAQFAGYYMAKAKGLYEREGLDVRILRGGPDVRPMELLREGKADFCSMMLASALAERDAGLSLVCVAQIVNRSNFLLIAWRQPEGGAPIRDFADLQGRRVAVWENDFRVSYLAAFAAAGVKPTLLPQYNTFALFLHHGADAFSGMRYNEYHTLLRSGVTEDQVRVFALKDHGVNMPEDGIYCLLDTWNRRPEICRAFARATLEGWQYARDHEEETLDVVMEYVDQDRRATNRPHMRWMLKEMIASIFPGPDGAWEAGRLSREAYGHSVDILRAQAGMASMPAYEDFVRGEAAHESH